MPVLTVYPDAHPEITSVDGYIKHVTAYDAGLTWADMIIAAGTEGNAHFDRIYILIKAASGVDTWMQLGRGILLFDTSALPDNASIQSAVLSLYGCAKIDQLGITPNLNIYSCLPNSNTDIIAGDFDTLGFIPYCDTPISYAAWSLVGYNDFILNAAGLAAISKTGITKLGTRNANYDVAGVAPPNWANQQSSYLYCYTADKGGGYRPKLVITYITISVTTLPASELRSSSANLNGILNDDGGESCDCGFEWGETDAYGQITPTASRTTGQTFLQKIIGLESSIIYHFRAFATNASGTGYGEDMTFITGLPPLDPTIAPKKVSLELIRNLEIMNNGRFYISKLGNAIYESRFHR